MPEENEGHQHTLKPIKPFTLTPELLKEYEQGEHHRKPFQDDRVMAQALGNIAGQVGQSTADQRRRPDVAIIGHVDQGRVLFSSGSSAVEPAVMREQLRLRQLYGIELDLIAGVWVRSTEGNPRPQEVVDIWVAGGRIPNVTHIAEGLYQMGCGPTHADAWLRPIGPDGVPLRR